MDLVLAQEELFQGIQCDVWMDNSNRKPFMTMDQIAVALEYSDRKGIEKIIERNPYLKKNEFSTTYALSEVEGKREVKRERRLFTRDGVMEVSFLSHKPKAIVFRAWARKVLNAFIDGQLVWKERREINKQEHKDLNAIIAEHYPLEKVQIRCIHFSQLLCELTTGFKSVGGYKKSVGVSDGRALAELLDEKQLKVYNEYLNRIVVFLESGFTFKEISAILKKQSISITIQNKETVE